MAIVGSYQRLIVVLIHPVIKSFENRCCLPRRPSVRLTRSFGAASLTSFSDTSPTLNLDSMFISKLQTLYELAF